MVEYSEIILDNCKNHSRVSWWPRFAYHFTDVTNAVNILSTGKLYSRIEAQRKNVMMNDNASRQVIDITSSDVVSLVRFYFRPLTPTQYYNEGYKHPDIRYNGDSMANVPIPIFFLFDIEEILNLPGIEFSEASQAGGGTQRHSGAEAFGKLNFDAIYSNGATSDRQVISCRHAEIVHRDSLSIEPYLRKILCRSSQEKITLLNLLKEQNRVAFERYRDKISVYSKDTFYNNGLRIESCIYHDNIISIAFSDSYEKLLYMRTQHSGTLSPLRVKIECCWLNTRHELHRETVSTLVDYAEPHAISVRLKMPPPTARELRIKVFFDDKLVCYNKQSLDVSEIIQ